MRSFILLLKRSVSIPKEVWRSPACRRTLAPIDPEPAIRSLWNDSRLKTADHATVSISLSEDGSSKNAPMIHSIQGNQKAFIGVFDAAFTSSDQVEVTLREEECARELRTPIRRTRKIGLLRPWTPLRVLLNGRSSGSSGQWYFLQEYFLVLCSEPTPKRLEHPRLVDLQADLM
jgi:hypothetical protein